MEGHFDCITQAMQGFQNLMYRAKIFQFYLTSRIWAVTLKSKLCTVVSRKALAAMFNQAQVVV